MPVGVAIGASCLVPVLILSGPEVEREALPSKAGIMTYPPADVSTAKTNLLTFNEYAALSALADVMTVPVLPAEIEVRLMSLGLAESQAQGLKLTVEGLARLRSGR